MTPEEDRAWKEWAVTQSAKLLGNAEKLKAELEEWHRNKPVKSGRPLTGDDDPDYLRVLLAVRSLRESLADAERAARAAVVRH
jgi:hypothetical protein